jgi:toluene monooxygenase system ferredoxin subunit
MSWQRVCSLDDVWEGDMGAFDVMGVRLLVVGVGPGEVRVYDARCPHQGWPLEAGTLAEGTLTCRQHRWRFDVKSGTGINPKDCHLRSFECRVENDEVFVLLPAAAAGRLEPAVQAVHS